MMMLLIGFWCKILYDGGVMFVDEWCVGGLFDMKFVFNVEGFFIGDY